MSLITALAAVFGCSKPATVERVAGIKLRLISNYGSSERLITADADENAVRETVNSLDWGGFHQVVLERPNGDWVEVGGSLDPSDGLSVMYEESGKQSVITMPPTRVAEMTKILLAYLPGDDGWKELGTWK